MFWDFDDWDSDLEDMFIYASLIGMLDEESEEEERLREELEEDSDDDPY